ncbi:hypothetical protein L915_02663 [Phytophthora nicotianae]|uniref:Uncharacterized protein n=3 Tax=Phytophthora nicotianae TaxID=4792 RepID=W2HGH0_PHYNI|nr:hypothetical protein L915_02663 [Phytophthora nicotianae]
MDYYGQDSGSEAWSERYEDCRGVERSVIVQTVVERLENASWRRAGLRDPGSASEEVAAAAQEQSVVAASDEGSTDAAENKGVMSQDTVAGLTKGTAAVLTEVKTEPVAKEKQGRNTEVFDVRGTVRPAIRWSWGLLASGGKGTDGTSSPAMMASVRATGTAMPRATRQGVSRGAMMARR